WHPIDSFSSEGLHKYWGPYGVLNSNDIICVTDTETVISFDHADSWSKIGDGLPTTYYNKRYVTSTKGTLFYMSDSGTFKSTFFTSTPKTAQVANNFNAHYDRVRNVIIVDKTTGVIDPENISLFDMTGRTVRTYHTTLSESKVEFEAQGILAGVYLMRYASTTDVYSAKILIMK
ncbi:MAG TPA: T9SS type A sorting domain-containing protein, partial [Candidatus Kapabacteria bacterium]